MNWWIVFFSVSFGLMETAYFGWNFTPQSDAEMICDGITILIGALAFLGKPYNAELAVSHNRAVIARPG